MLSFVIVIKVNVKITQIAAIAFVANAQKKIIATVLAVAVNMKKVIFTEDVYYGGFINKGTIGTLSKDEKVLSISISDYSGYHLLGSLEARFEYPISAEAGYGDIMAKIMPL